MELGEGIEKRKNSCKKIYSSFDTFPDISKALVPDWNLANISKYNSLCIQFSRGCPFDCEFCDVVVLNGRKPRSKSKEQLINELNALYSINWRAGVFFVDDNFIGNKKIIKNDLLPAMKKWMQKHKYPFVFNAETSVNLADDEELMLLMVESGFTSTFVGIETPDEKSLQDCNKKQNGNRDLLESVKKMQKAGLQVSGGFIVGFDSDTPAVFQHQIDFIQKSGIVSAMVGLLNAPKNTKLYKRLKAENRLTIEATGNNTDSSMNFVPKMDTNELLEGYKTIIRNIYAIKPYYTRIRQFLLNYKRFKVKHMKLEFSQLNAFIKSVIIIGILDKGRGEYWKLLFWTLFRRPSLMIDAVTYAVYGYHFRIIYGLRKSRR